MVEVSTIFVHFLAPLILTDKLDHQVYNIPYWFPLSTSRDGHGIPINERK